MNKLRKKPNFNQLANRDEIEPEKPNRDATKLYKSFQMGKLFENSRILQEKQTEETVRNKELNEILKRIANNTDLSLTHLKTIAEKSSGRGPAIYDIDKSPSDIITEVEDEQEIQNIEEDRQSTKSKGSKYSAATTKTDDDKEIKSEEEEESSQDDDQPKDIITNEKEFKKILPAKSGFGLKKIEEIYNKLSDDMKNLDTKEALFKALKRGIRTAKQPRKFVYDSLEDRSTKELFLSNLERRISNNDLKKKDEKIILKYLEMLEKLDYFKNTGASSSSAPRN